jgi:hypothetical protein
MTTGAALAGLLVAAALPARADIVLIGQSESYGVSADLTLAPILGSSVRAVIDPYPVASGTAPAPFSDTESAASVDLSAGPVAGGSLVTFRSGLLEEVATSNVDGLPGPRTTAASGSINDLALSVFSTAAPGIEITADTLVTSSVVTGDFGSLTAAGSLTVTNLQIRAYGVLLATIQGAIAPNTMVDLGAAFVGASLILNEQILSGDGISSLALTVNAVDLRLTDTAFLGFTGPVNGQVIVEHSFAEQTARPVQAQAVPEASTVVLAGVVGVIGLGYGWRRRRAAA